MQRSTISLIVEALVNEHWVIEGPTGRLPRGRRPTFLRLNDDRVIIAVDIRPSQITIALSDVNGKFTSQEAIATPSDAKVAVDAIIARIQGIVRSCPGKKIEGVGITVPGRVDRASGQLVFAPNLKWKLDVDLGSSIAAATGLEVELENAANACVLAAVWFNRVETCRNLVVVTVTEGIGCGILLNGKLARGLHGMAGEFGHAPVDPQGPLCGCGKRGCWEVYGANGAALRYYQESSSNPDSVSFQDLLTLADHGDTHAANALETMASYVGRWIRIIVAGLAPERILVIGDLTRSWERFGPIIEAEVCAQVLPGGGTPLVVPVHEAGMARLRGTVALVLQKHFGTGEEIPG
jgi:predicted NBD/HSP70 family sugar kinase